MSIRFERIKEILKAKYYKDFSKFMQGQTFDLKEGIYEEDIIRWIKKLPVID